MGFDKLGMALFAATLMVSTSAVAEPVKREGVIISHTDNNLRIQTREGPVNVVMAPDITIKEAKGLSRKTREAKVLIPGLIITVEGDQQGETVNAVKIQYQERDWRSAVATRAGTIEQFSELKQAIIDGQEYVVREELTVYFASGSTNIANEFRLQLQALAQNASSYGNYRIAVLGFADPKGNAAANERLSRRRADAVSNFLRQTGHIQPARVLSPSAMGEGTSAPGETAPASNQQARRVLVRVVTPKSQLGK